MFLSQAVQVFSFGTSKEEIANLPESQSLKAKSTSSVTIEKTLKEEVTKLIEPKAVPEIEILQYDPKISKQDLLDQIQTGDILLWTSTHRFTMGYCMRGLSRTPWTHAMIAFRPEGDNTTPLVYQTSQIPYVDIDEKTVHSQSSICDLSEAIDMYTLDQGYAAHCIWLKLQAPDTGDEELNEAMRFFRQRAMKDFIDRTRGTPYHFSFINCGILSKFGVKTQQDSETMFCSELVAEGLRQMGILDPECISWRFTPPDFHPDHGNLQQYLINGYTYAQPVLVISPKLAILIKFVTKLQKEDEKYSE